MKKLIVSFIFLVIAFPMVAMALSWTIIFVVWNGNVYEVTEEAVAESQIRQVIGEVKTKENEYSGKFHGNASNYYPIGTKYYDIEGTPSSEEIAVETEEGQWVKAIFAHKAPFHLGDFFIRYLPFFLSGVVLLLGFILFKKKKPPV
ncbi:hypothetical protein [Bacillus sp. SD088]|uniref:hypothetical protein n=1 Tax=Bacillus sp. SD088 TaxID=2782012 RepID=UPI001F616171|nr:hypothetical protein [Bacillus sp. SD088]